jgi:hypothetical protein
MFSAPSGPDAQLRRIERHALVFVAILVVLAAVSGGRRAVLGAVAGGLIAAVSYRAIAGGVSAIVAAPVRDGTTGAPSTTWGLVKFITRFAILGAIAYVMMVRLRAQPVWMLLGASSLVAAAALDAVRAPRARP